MNNDLDYNLYVKYDDETTLRTPKANHIASHILQRFIKHRKIWLDEDDNLFEEV